VYGSGKAWKTQGIFFSYFVATLDDLSVTQLTTSKH